MLIIPPPAIAPDNVYNIILKKKGYSIPLSRSPKQVLPNRPSQSKLLKNIYNKTNMSKYKTNLKCKHKKKMLFLNKFRK